MDAKRDAGILGLADVWDGLDPRFVEQALQPLQLLTLEPADSLEPISLSGFADRTETVDPLERIVRDRVLARIMGENSQKEAPAEEAVPTAPIETAAPTASATTTKPVAPDVTDAEHWHSAFDQLPARGQSAGRKPQSGPGDWFKRWQQSPYARMTAAAVLIIAMVWILSLPALRTGTATTTTAATTRAGTTAAATTTAGTTAAAGSTKVTTAAAATTAAGTTAAATTAAGTTAATTAAGTTAATTASTTGAGQITWPIHLSKYLGFNTDPGENGVRSVDVIRFRADGSTDRMATITDRSKLLAISDLINQAYLDRPLSTAPKLTGVRYELVFHLQGRSGQPVPSDQTLTLSQMSEVNMIIFNGTFTATSGIRAPYGMVQTNSALTFSEVESRLGPLLG